MIIRSLVALVRFLSLPTRAWSMAAIDCSVLAYALWTVTCHGVMLAGGDTYALAWACAGVTVVSLGLAALLLRRRQPAQPSDEPASASAPPEVPGLGEQALLGALAVVVVAFWLWRHDPLAQWLVVIGYLALALAFCLRDQLSSPRDSRHNSRRHELGLWAMAIASGLLALYVHRWRNDDCYYVNIAVTIADFPHAALLSLNTIHAPFANDAASNLVFTPYRVHSFEALGGLISFLTGIEAIRVLHVGIAGVAGALIPLALARLFRLLDPERWFLMVVAAMCLYLLDGSADRGFENQGIVRMFTGKSVMLSVAVPLIVRHAIAFGQRRSALTFALLASAQIAAIGLSSTALWLAPTCAMLGLVVPLRLDLRSLRRVSVGALSCLYVITIALWVRAQIMVKPSAVDGSRALAIASKGLSLRFSLLTSSFEQNLGDSRVTLCYLSLLLFSIPLCRSLIARRYLVVFGLALALLLMNPYFANFLRHNVYGRYTGQRAFWAAPLPAAFALSFVAPITPNGTRLRRWLGILAMSLGLWLFLSTVPSTYVLSRANKVVLKWPPGPKVPRQAFSAVRRLTSVLPANAIVLAPELVSWYLPTVHKHPYPLLANAKYLRASGRDERRRKKLVHWVSHRERRFGSHEARDFTAAIADYDISAIVLGPNGKFAKGLTGLIKQSGFKRVPSTPGYQFWIRRDVVGATSHEAAR